jgi:hypothetical protein
MDKATIIREALTHEDELRELGNRFGKTQFRTMSELCRKAECMEEIYLLIEYKTAKGNGWEKTCRKEGKDERFGHSVIGSLVTLTKSLDKVEACKVASLFFGYLHWKATEVLASAR